MHPGVGFLISEHTVQLADLLEILREDEKGTLISRGGGGGGGVREESHAYLFTNTLGNK